MMPNAVSKMNIAYPKDRKERAKIRARAEKLLHTKGSLDIPPLSRNRSWVEPNRMWRKENPNEVPGTETSSIFETDQELDKEDFMSNAGETEISSINGNASRKWHRKNPNQETGTETRSFDRKCHSVNLDQASGTETSSANQNLLKENLNETSETETNSANQTWHRKNPKDANGTEMKRFESGSVAQSADLYIIPSIVLDDTCSSIPTDDEGSGISSSDEEKDEDENQPLDPKKLEPIRKSIERRRQHKDHKVDPERFVDQDSGRERRGRSYRGADGASSLPFHYTGTGNGSSGSFQSPRKPYGAQSKSIEPERLRGTYSLDENDWEDTEEVDDMFMLHRGPLGRRGKLVTFYRNGDSHFKGLTTSVNQKSFNSFEALLVWLNEKIPTTAGVRYVYALPDGKELTDVNEFIGGRSYVASSTKRLILVPYGKTGHSFWKNKKLSAGRLRKGEQDLYNKERRSQSFPGSRTSSTTGFPYRNNLSPQAVKPRVLTIISNSERKSQEKVILNPQTTQTFEEMLQDISAMVKIDQPPVSALYTAREPYVKVKSFSHLLRDLKSVDEFLACGKEGFPIELMQQAEELSDATPVEPPPLRASRLPRRALREKAFERLTPPTHRKQYPPPIPPLMQSPQETPTRYSHPQYDQLEVESVQSDPLPQSSTYRYRRPLAVTSSKQMPIARRRDAPQFDIINVDIHGNPREFYAPRYAAVESDGSKPSKRLKLDWVYGYRGRDGRNNLFVLPSGELVYYVASVGVVYNKRTHSQAHYTGHTEEISCMALHPDKFTPYIATGQVGGKTQDSAAHIRIWDARNLNTYAIIGVGFFQDGVSAVNFSGETGDWGGTGDLILAVDESDKHTLSVWDWQKDRCIAKTTTSSDTVVWGAFHPRDFSTIITYGKQHIFFWKLFWDPDRDAMGRILRDKKSGNFEGDSIPRFVTSLAFSNAGDVITGDSNGRIAVWGKDRMDAFTLDNKFSEHMRHAHEKSVFALCMLNDGTLLSGGGNEIKAWDSMNDYRPVKERVIPDTAGLIRTLVPQQPLGLDGGLYIGTTNNLILEGTLQDKFNYLVQGHSEELWALATHPDDQSFVTAGYDQHVCKWSTLKHRLVWRVHVEKPCLSVAFDPKGNTVIAGTTVGRFIVLNANNGMHVTSVQIGTDQLDSIKFSPGGVFLAMGSHDCNVYVYSVHDDGQVYRKYKQGVLQGHNNFITHLDWSADGKFLQTVSGDYDLMFWNLENMSIEEPQHVTDEEWETLTTILGYSQLGAWSNLQEAEDINCMCRNNMRDHIAVGDNQGSVRLYRFPCNTEQPAFVEKNVYSGHTTNLAFTFDDSRLITTGGIDAGLLQWSVVEAADLS